MQPQEKLEEAKMEYIAVGKIDKYENENRAARNI